MNKRLIVIFLVFGITHCVCPASNQLQDIEANSVTFNILENPNKPTQYEETYQYNFKLSFSREPLVSLGIQGIETNNATFSGFFLNIGSSTRNSLRIIFKKYQIGVWKQIHIFFIASDSPSIILGSMNTQFGSLRGDRAISKTYFNRNIETKAVIIRAFLNGFSTNMIRSIQISLAKQTISQNNQLTVQVITGPDFDLKEVWYSYIIFSPFIVDFTSFGKTYQQIHFQGQIAHDITDVIQYSKYKLIGISLINIMNPHLNPINIQTRITQDFVLYLKSTEFIDKISINYIILGNTPKQTCRKCFQNYAFMDQCLDECPKGTYPYRFPRRLGYGCRRCPKQLNLVLNQDSSGCKCSTNSIYRSGVCEKIIIQQQQPEELINSDSMQIQETSNTVNQVNAQQIYQITEQIVPNDCSHLKNTYWTGYRCACNIGYIPLQSGCESFISYIRSLTYSSTFYPSQQEAKTSNTLVALNPCKIHELRVNGTCECKQNYYKSVSGNCIQCPPNSYYNNFTKKCQCQRNFRFQQRTNSCIIDCPLNMVLNVNTKECICRNNYGLIQGVCRQCPKNKGGFIAFGKCFFCPGNTIFLGNSCGCHQGQILENNTLCRSCPLFEVPYNNQCQCFYPYRRNQFNGQCERTCTIKQIKLLGQCIDCPPFSYNNGMNICACDQGFILVQRRCIPLNRSCVDGFYRLRNQCVSCPAANCMKCDGVGKCTECQPNYQLGPDYQCRSICSDGYIYEGKEQCDDGNRLNGDGCDQNCQKQPGYYCFGQPTFCLSICGNGMLTRYQKCDDGNKIDGDGCSSRCSIERGYSCFGNPSECIKYDPNIS